MRHNRMYLDAQAALGFLLAQTAIIEPGVYATKYPDILYRDLVPVDTSGSEFATSVTYYSSDQHGQAKWVNGNADDVPLAGTNRAKHETGVHTAAIGYGYGFEELGRAQMLGVNLTNDDAMAARRASEEMVDRVALMGDAQKGFTGLFNAAGVTPVAAPTGSWDTATPAQIVADMNAALLNIFNDTNTTAMADRLLLPWSSFFKISSTPMSAGSDTTILQFYLETNPYTATTGRPLTIRGVRHLETAGAAGVKRVVAYRFDREVLKLHMPMPHRFLQPWQTGSLRFEVPGVMRLGGLDVRLPKEVAYIDGV